ETAVSWGFTAEPGTAVRCRLTRGISVISDWSVCTSPTAYDLAGDVDGTYTFSAYATDAAGNAGAPVIATYVLDRAAPAAPTSTTTPTSPDHDPTVAWAFTGEAGATFDCRVDRGATQIADWAPCSSPDAIDLTAQSDGTYTFAVRATDAAGNTGAVA